jgi:hypothetical protein
MSEETSLKYKINPWRKPKGPGSRPVLRDYLNQRFPGDGFSNVKVYLEQIQEGIILQNILDQQIAMKADSDGDMFVISPRDEVSSMIDRSRQDRLTVTKYFRMLGFNRTIPAMPPIATPPKHVGHVWWPEEAMKQQKESSISRYTKLMNLEDTPLADWLSPHPLWRPEDGTLLGFNVDVYSDWMERVSRFNTSGIGHAYNMWHVCVMMCAMYYNVNWALYQFWKAILDLCATLYEDLFLAGGPSDDGWAFFALLDDPDVEKLAQWTEALKALKFKKIDQDILIPMEDGKNLRVNQTRGLFLARQLTIAYQAYWNVGYIPKAQKDSIGMYAEYVPMLGLMRSLLGFNMKTRWMKRMPTREQISKVIASIPEQSPIWAYYSDVLRTLYPFAIQVAQVSEERMYNQE